MSTLDVLVRARALVERGWCTGVEARDEHGNQCDESDSPSAVSWCMIGAVYRGARKEDDIALARKAARCLTATVGGLLDQWNDAPGRTQSEVLAAFDRAIEAARPAGSEGAP